MKSKGRPNTKLIGEGKTKTMNTKFTTAGENKMSKKIKTVQEELESRRENKQNVHQWLREQSGQPADIHEWIHEQNQAEQRRKNDEKIN